MSTAFQALERTRANLGELIAVAAAELEATETNAAQAVEQAADLAYQRGLEAGQALGRDALKAEVLATIHAPAPMHHLSRSQLIGDLALGLAFVALFFAIVTHD